MKWAQEHSSTSFELPNMPHLNNEQKILFKQQVREREEDLELKRKEDSRAMAAEDRAQKEMKRKKKNESKRKRAAEELEMNSKDTEKTIGSDNNVGLMSEDTIKLEETNKISEFKEFSATNADEVTSRRENNQMATQNKDGKEAEEKAKIKVERAGNEEL